MGERTGLKIPDWFEVGGQIATITDNSLARYLSQPVVLETDSTIGNESNQLPKNPTPKESTEISPKPKRKKSVLVPGDEMSIPELLAEASPR